MERVVHNPVDLMVEVPRPVVIEKTIEVPKIQIEERTIKVPKVLHTTVDTVVQNQVETIEVVKPTVVGAPSGLSSKRLEVHKVVQRKKPVIQEQVQHVPKAGGKQFGLLSSEVMVQQVPVQKVVEKQVGSLAAVYVRGAGACASNPVHR